MHDVETGIIIDAGFLSGTTSIWIPIRHLKSA